MKKALLICFMFLVYAPLFAQSAADTIEVKKGFSPAFKYNGENLNLNQLLEITKSNPEAYKEMKIAKGKATMANVLGYAGGFLLGYPVGTAIGGGKPNWGLAGVGAGIIALALPFNASLTKHAQNAARIYNNGPTQTSLKPVDVKLGFTGNGLGLNLLF
ncbi:hypothetical protein [Rufibacter hautae]|uniref:Uncharacterized protein n=1 Tax=Rufibacter hautae TaxID=2595005 RepID=A0A5B6TES2_9BACT|nr:hypothetical protein [Rufibacter hautae]KAA3438391.1 hypothetical protein FOA19_14215 [Rufibacter hautae]